MSGQPDKLDTIVSYLECEFGMNPEESKEILDIFFEESESLIVQLEEAIKNGDCTQAAMHAHAIKGSAANINALNISGLALEIESGGKNNNRSAVESNFPLLKSAFTQLKKEYASGN